MKRPSALSPALLLAISAPFAFARQAATPPPATVPIPFSESNPFAKASPLPYEAPLFDRIKESDYTPALEEGMKRQIAEIDAIADNPEPPTFANTLEAMERSGELLTRAAKVFFNLAQSNTSETMQKIKAEEAPRLAAHQDAIFLNAKLFARVKSLYDRRDALGLDPESRYLVERYSLNFVRAGAQLSDADKTTLRAYQPDERVFEVFDADGKSLALFYGDYFSRSNKSGGAWQDSFVDQSFLLGMKPAVFNVTNFTKPASGQPALISFEDVTTLFHEFGHALHAMFARVRYPTLLSVPRDFVEFPSQFNEHWALEPSVLASYAKHFQTGKPMPQALVDKIKKARTFNQGYKTTEYLAAALLDMAWHELPAGAPPQDVNVFETSALKRFDVDLPQVPPRYHTTYFSHIWPGGYAAGYYAYLWSEVIDDDAWYWFKENGGMTRANGRRFREMILSRGGTQDAAALYRAFRGRDPKVEPLIEERGLKPTAK